MTAVAASLVGCVVSTYSTLDLGYDEGNVSNESILYSARPQAVVPALRSTCTHQLKSSARRSMDTFGFRLGHYLRGRMAVIPEQAYISIRTLPMSSRGCSKAHGESPTSETAALAMTSGRVGSGYHVGRYDSGKADKTRRMVGYWRGPSHLGDGTVTGLNPTLRTLYADSTQHRVPD